MNEVRLSGSFERGISLETVDRGGQDFMLARGSLNFFMPRADKEVRMWIDVECVGPAAYEMSEIPEKIAVMVTGEIRRAAWKDKETGEWQSRHFIYYRAHELSNPAGAPPPEDDLPF